MKLRKFWGVRIVMCVICFGKNESGENLLVTDGWYLKKQSETKNINPQQKRRENSLLFYCPLYNSLAAFGFYLIHSSTNRRLFSALFAYPFWYLVTPAALAYWVLNRLWRQVRLFMS